MVLAAILCLGFVLAGRVLRRIAIGQIAALTNTKVQAKSLNFNFNGSVFIEELVIRPPLVADSSVASQQQKYNDTIFSAETVYARFSLGSLLLLRPRLKEISVKNFVFNAQYDLDERRWNVGALKINIPKGGSGKMPLVELENGVLQYSKVSNGQVKAVTVVPLDARFGPAEKIQDGYRFDITTAERAGVGKSTLRGFWQNGKITVAGKISSADLPAFERTWEINALDAELNYGLDKTYSLKLKIKDLLHTRSPDDDTLVFDSQAFLETMGPLAALQRFFSRYRPAGQVDVDLEASGDLEQLSKSTLVGKIHCKDVSICYYKFAYPVEHIAGQIDFTEKSILLNNLSGEHNDVKLTFNGWSRNPGINRQYQIQISSDNLALDNDLYDALNTKQKKFWSSFSPSGLAAIDYHINRQSPNDKKKTLAVKLLDAEAAYRHFPYPLKNLTGRLVFDSNGITVVDVASQFNEREITLKGTVETGGTNQPTYNISIKANNIPLDSTLVSALPAKQGHFYNQLDTAGLIRIDNLTGRVWSANENKQPAYSLLLHTEQLELDDTLFGLLPTAAKENVAKLQPEGKVNISVNLDKTGSEDYPAYKITVDCLGNSINFEPLEYLLKDITGSLTITKNNIELKDITAIVADDVEAAGETPAIKINGQMALADNTFNSIGFELSTKISNFHIRSVITELDAILKIKGLYQAERGLCNTQGAIWADKLKVEGKTLSNLKADIYYDSSVRSWSAKHLVADCYGGRLAGKFTLKQPADSDSEYLLQIGFGNIDLRQFLSDAKPKETRRNDYTGGKMSGSLGISATVDDTYSRIGRCRVSIRDMQVGRLSPLAKLLGVLNLTEPGDFAFEQMLVDSYVKRNILFFKQFDLSGEALAFNGSGRLELQEKNIDLILTARGRRLAGSEPSILQSLTDALGQGVVRMEVRGDFYDPQITTTTLPVIKEGLQILGTAR